MDPQSIKHGCLEYHYTKLVSSSRYSTMHIYAWQMDPQSINHTCLEDHYTKEVSHIGQCTYQPTADGHPQSSIHALNTTTPGDLTQRTSTYKRPFTHEGNYLVFLLLLSCPWGILGNNNMMYNFSVSKCKYLIMLALALAVLAYSNGTQFCFIAELQSTWLVTWAMKRTPPTHPIGHQALRVEVTWAMRRMIPHPPHTIGHQELKWHEQWGGPHPPFIIRSWDLKRHKQWGGPPPPTGH